MIMSSVPTFQISTLNLSVSPGRVTLFSGMSFTSILGEVSPVLRGFPVWVVTRIGDSNVTKASKAKRIEATSPLSLNLLQLLDTDDSFRGKQLVPLLTR